MTNVLQFKRATDMLRLAEKVGILYSAAPNTQEGLGAAKAKIAEEIKASGSTPKALAAYLTKTATANRRRVNVNWLVRMGDK